MPVSIGPRIQVDGEEEYRRQIREIIEQSKTLDAEMKAMAAGFSDTATEQEKAAAMSGKLSEALELARKRTELVRGMTAEATAAYEEDSVQVSKWRQALATANEEQAKAVKAWDENTRAINEQIEVISEAAKLQQEYTPVLKNIDEQAKALEAEMRALTASFSEDITEQEKAEKTAELLNKQLEVSQRRAEMLGELLQKTSEETGDTSEETLKLRQAYAAAQEQVAKLEHAVEENTRAIDAQGEEMADSSEKMVGWGDTLNDIGDKLGIRIPQAATDALNGIDAFSVGTVAQMAAVAGGVAAAYKGIEALVDITLEAAEKADALLTRSAQTGIDVETLQGLEYSSNFLDFEGIDQILVKLTTSMDKARDGAEKQAEAFAALGVSVTDADGQLKNNYDTFLEVIDALGKVENATERDALANALFGKSFSEMNPLIDAGSKALQGFMDEAKQTGIVLTEDQAKKLVEVNDAYRKSQARVEAFKNKLAVEFAPAAKAAMDTFSEAVEKGGDALIKSGIISGVGAAVQSVLALVDAGADLMNALPAWLSPLESVKNQLEMLATASAAVADTIDLISGIMPWNWGSGKATTALGLNLGQGQMSHMQELEYGSGWTGNNGAWTQNSEAYGYDPAKGLWYDKNGNYIYPKLSKAGYNAAGTESWRGGLTWVGESGPELVSLPQGSAIYSNQESRQIAAAATDTSRIESLLERCLQRMDGIERELADGEAVRRMA